MKLYDSASKQKKPFTPIDPSTVKLYVCGVTVYDYCHIGHARVATFFDTVSRFFQSQGRQVEFVRNVTDIDDKIIRRSEEAKVPYDELAATFEQAMRDDFAALNAQVPWKEPKATDFISNMIELIETLIEKGAAYPANNGDVYFRVTSDEDYGKLSHQSIDALLTGARVEENSAKDNPLDFVLWKAAKPGEPSWASPWGEGRPGWHIECSAMVLSTLGQTIDIHGGGHDLLFPHHENEIAQAESATGKPYVNYWMHVGFVNIDNEKMSKSLDNFFTIREVIKQYPPEVIRYFLMASHYRSPVNYSDAALSEAKKACQRLYGPLKQYPDIPASKDSIGGYWERFEKAMEDDFNTPVAFSIMFECVNDINKSTENAGAKVGVLRYMGEVLGLMLQDVQAIYHDDRVDQDWVASKIEARNQARADRAWAKADAIRDELQSAGIILEDAAGTTTWRQR